MERWIQDATRALAQTGKKQTRGKYLKGAEARARNRRINILHLCGLNSVAIAPHVKVTAARVRQILDAHSEPLYIGSFAEIQAAQQNFLAATLTPFVPR